MASYNQVSYGSRGNDVLELQKKLNQNGYKLTEDGIFGNNTLNAVREYQKKMGLAVDGIVGNNTWGALYQQSTSASGDGADAGDAVDQAQQMVQESTTQNPGGYQSQWQAQLDEIMQKILNREDFSYDLNGDALYQQYKDQYTAQGQQAMMDTMGQAQAMTGGYGNSYAQSVGQQAYNSHLQQLNDRIPELYSMALSKYQMDGQALTDQLSVLGAMEEQDYGRYRDTVADQQWQAEFDEAKRQYDQAWEQEYGSSTGSSSGGSGGSGGGGGGYDNGSVSTAAVKQMQIALGVTADGKWGPATKAASGGLSADEAWKLYNQGKLGEAVGDAARGKKQLDEDKESGSMYSGWDAGTWEGYFSRIRQSEGRDAAMEELNYFISKGWIPQNMITYASSGARGGQMGH